MLEHLQAQNLLESSVKFSQIEDNDLKQYVLNQNKNLYIPHSQPGTFVDRWFGNNKPSDDKTTEKKDIDYELKNHDDQEIEDTDPEEIEDWWGVEREGHSHDQKGTSSDSQEDDDDGPDGGEMMPILDVV